MRKKLKRINNKRQAFTGTVVCFGTAGGNGQTLLVKDIYNTNQILVAEHVWVNFPSQFEDLKLKRDDKIRFSATVRPYTKHFGKSKDYGLTKVRNIKRVLG